MMISQQSAGGAGKRALALAGGVFCGLITLVIASGIYWAFGSPGSGDDDTAGGATSNGGIDGGIDGPADGSRTGSTVTSAELRRGDCIQFDNSSGEIVGGFSILDCSSPHGAQITGQLEHPNAGQTYPGNEALNDWLGTKCLGLTEAYIGVPLLDTTLDEGAFLPSFEDWTVGTFNTSCYVLDGNGGLLSQSVQDAGINFPRGDQVAISRLRDGDCFRAVDAADIVSLGSQNPVALVDCGANPQGIFFGTRRLSAFTSGAPFPGDEQARQTAEDLCAEAFSDFFGVGSVGFDFRFWRPSAQSWEVGDRTVHCAVVDSDGIPENYEPDQYRPFFDLEPGDCFDLAPAAPTDFVGLDQRLLPRSCTDPHVGQKIISGQLEAEAGAAAATAPELAGTACGQPATDFLGISTNDSRANVVGSWPLETAWEEGDRRFGCAVLEASPVTESFEGIGI